MANYSIYNQSYVDTQIERLNQLTENTIPQWGKMNAGQMLAHLCVSYDMAFTNKYTKPNILARWILKKLVKPGVVGPKPYPKNSRTAPQFIINDARNFEEEKANLIGYLQKVSDLGEDHFDDKFYHSFGKMKAAEWNVLFGKHLEHHFTQFGI